MYGEDCVFEGDVILGRVDANGALRISGLITQQEAHNESEAHSRRLSVIKGYNAFYWPNGVVRVVAQGQFLLVIVYLWHVRGVFLVTLKQSCLHFLCARCRTWLTRA